MLKITYEQLLSHYNYIKKPIIYIQNLTYYLDYDENIQNLIKLIEKYSNIDIETEEFRKEIIVNGYAENIQYMDEIFSKLFDISFNKYYGVLRSNSIEDIEKCCNVFPDNKGKRLLKYVGLQKIIKIASAIIKKYNNGNYKSENNYNEVLIQIKENQKIINVFFDKIYNNEEMYFSYIKQTIEDYREQKNMENDKLSESFTAIFNSFKVKEEDVCEYFNLSKIKTDILNIKEEKWIEEKDIFINELNKHLKRKFTEVILQSIFNEAKNNHFIYKNIDEIILIILNNRTEKKLI